MTFPQKRSKCDHNLEKEKLVSQKLKVQYGAV